MDGASPGSVWTLSAGGRSLPWATGIGTADSAGHVAGYVLVADSLSFGDHAIAACSPGYPNGECTQPLRHRSFARFETEDLNVVGHQGSWRGAKYAPDWLPPGSTERWGRNIAAVLEGSGTSSYVEYRFYAPTMTTCRVRYMMGGTMTGAVIRSKVNGDTDLDSYDTYRSTGYWWTRLDTVNGQWRSLTGGPQTLRIEVTGRHPSSSGWTVISDQIIIESSPDGVVGKPRSPADLTASLSDSGIRLVWSAVREDETGNPLVPAGYLVLSCLGMDSADELIGTVSGNDTTFLDERPFPVAQLPVIYFVIAESDSGGLPISSPSTPGHPRQHKKRSAPVGSALPLR